MTRSPWGVAADENGTPRLFVPRRGLVHWPSVASYLYEGEVGGKRITEAEATRLMRSGVGRVDPDYADVHKGNAPTIRIDEGGPGSRTYVTFPHGRRLTREEALLIGGLLFDALAAEQSAGARDERKKKAGSRRERHAGITRRHVLLHK